MRVRVDFNVDDTTKSTEALLKRLLPAWKAAESSGAHLELDFADCQYLGPAAMALLFALLADLDAHGRKWTFVPPKLQRLRAYCQFSGLLHRAGVGGPPNRDHPDNVTIPTRTFSAYDAQAIEDIVRLVRRFIPMSTQTESVLRSSIAELIQNVLDHAKSPTGGFITARAFSHEREVRFVVADTGIGVRRALSARHPNLGSDADAVVAAFDEHRTSQTTAHNRGLGLYHLSEMVRYNGGEIAFLSNTGSAERHGASALHKRTMDQEFPGTMAIVRFRVDDALYGSDAELAADIEL
ncbi:MAG: hypothetical protein K8M05_38545 [Deltaproteobacteria bacterium]|nr:hypothetical protein [Kofleriaceae bacterium]